MSFDDPYKDEVEEVENPLIPPPTAPMESWPALLPFHIAEHELSLGTPLYNMEEIAEHFDLTVEQIDLFKQQRTFKAEVRAAMSEIKDTNSVIRQKAKAQFEYYLDTLVPLWLGDERFPPNEKVKLYQYLGKTARITDDPLDKLKAELDAAPTEKTTTLNLYLTTPSGEATQMTGITINQEPEKLPNVPKT